MPIGLLEDTVQDEPPPLPIGEVETLESFRDCPFDAGLGGSLDLFGSMLFVPPELCSNSCGCVGD